jgi:hypothetical protein
MWGHMSYEELKLLLGQDAANGLENAVLAALAAARSNGPASEAALRTLLMSMVGAIIWSSADDHSLVDDIVQQCIADLDRALGALKHPETTHARGVALN